MTRNTNGKGFSLKDQLFNEKKVQQLGSLFAKADISFDANKFLLEVMQDMLHLPLKQRIVCIAKALESQLSVDFQKACRVIVRALPTELDPANSDNDFGDFIYASLGEYVVRNGLSKTHLDISLDTLREITKRFSMEDAIRHFLNAFEEETMNVLKYWVKDDNYHVRRLVSEGTRPLLPWSGRIALEATEPLPFLHILQADHTRYVTRSVANHMNDISKIAPDVVVATLQDWKQIGKQDEKELDWMIRHSLRTLVKQGNTEALELLGYETKPHIFVSNTTVNRSILKMGESLEFSFSITAQRDEKLMIDYVIDFVKANGKTKPKVFKLKKLEIKKGDTVSIPKKHRLLADATTFKLYPGKYRLTLQINGILFNAINFELNT